MRQPLKTLILPAALVIAIAASGCSADNEAGRAATPSSQSTIANSDLRDRLPESMTSSGKIIVGTSMPYAPAEFTDDSGKLTGFEVELMDVIAHELGLKAEWRNTEFNSIIPGVEARTYDIGARLIFDTKDREQHVDMVTYFAGGTQWAQRAGDSIDPNAACGSTVGVENGTIQATSEIPAKSQACTTIGDDPIQAKVFASVGDAVSALQRGQIDAVSADSPAVAHQASMSNDRIVVIGNPFDTQPYGFPVRKDPGWGDVLVQVVQNLIDTGRMKELAQRWGLDASLVSKSRINGATES